MNDVDKHTVVYRYCFLKKCEMKHTNICTANCASLGSYAMCSTESAVLSARMLLRTCYSMCGTELAYAPTPLPVLTYCTVLWCYQEAAASAGPAHHPRGA
eukprot:1112551-Rhodomonas_salina.1